MLVPTVNCLLSRQHPVRTFGHYIIQVSVTHASFPLIVPLPHLLIFHHQGGSRVEYALPCLSVDRTWLCVGRFEVDYVSPLRSFDQLSRLFQICGWHVGQGPEHWRNGWSLRPVSPCFMLRHTKPITRLSRAYKNQTTEMWRGKFILTRSPHTRL